LLFDKKIGDIMFKFIALLILLGANLYSQNLYTNYRVVKMELEFYDTNFIQLLEQNKEDKIDLPARLIVDDEFTFDSVGVRYKGNSSYNAKTNKKSFNISIDEFIDGEDLWGFETLNLNNCFVDPTFMREYLTNAIFGRYMPALKTGFVYLYVNGVEYGLYSNVEQINKDYLGNWYSSKSGNLYKGDPRGELTWRGEDPNLYKNDYEKKTNEDEDDWSDLIELINVINNSTDLINDLPEVLDTDRALWYFALCNAFVNLDSYIFSSHNYFLYDDPADGRFDFLPWDMNESFGTFPPNLPFQKSSFPPIDLNAPNRTPLLKKLLADPHYRSIYLAHYRTILRESFSPDSIRKMIDEIRPVIEQYVQNDPMKLYTYEDFQNNIYVDVLVEGRKVPGLMSLVEDRNDYLYGFDDYVKAEPMIKQVLFHTGGRINPEGNIVFEVEMQSLNTSAVLLHLRIGEGRFNAIEMSDNGKSPDENPGDNIYSVNFHIPQGTAGMYIDFYITAKNDQNVMKFYPERAEFEFMKIRIEGALSNSDIVINEFMAWNTETIPDPQGDYEDWIELYNKSDKPVSLNGWYLTDKEDEIERWQFPDVTIEPDGFLLIWADEDIEDEGLHADFKLSKEGEYIGLYDAEQNLIDSYTFIEQTDYISEGRYPNGTGDFVGMYPTPDSENLYPLSVEIDDNNNRIIIYPNPASENIMIKMNEAISSFNYQIRIYNTFGEMVFSEMTKPSNSTHSLNISGLPAGIYYIMLGDMVERFVKM
jgi:spore coat protein CotH